jgi:hypothetical protein
VICWAALCGRVRIESSKYCTAYVRPDKKNAYQKFRGSSLAGQVFFPCADTILLSARGKRMRNNPTLRLKSSGMELLSYVAGPGTLC